MRAWPCLLLVAGLSGCRVLHSGLGATAAGLPDAAAAPDLAPIVDLTGPDAQTPVDVGEPPGVAGPPATVGCSDGTREGFRDLLHWPNIAGCAGGWSEPGVIGSPDLSPPCGLASGDTSANPAGTGCGAADLCAAGWHICRNGYDVSQHSPTGDCESCVPAGEPRFFVAATGASPMGICSSDGRAVDDLHGCGGLGQPETESCAPLSRRMGFADCLATDGVWSCGQGGTDSLQEGLLVTIPDPSMGGALCCRN